MSKTLLDLIKETEKRLNVYGPKAPVNLGDGTRCSVCMNQLCACPAQLPGGLWDHAHPSNKPPLTP